AFRRGAGEGDAKGPVETAEAASPGQKRAYVSWLLWMLTVALLLGEAARSSQAQSSTNFFLPTNAVPAAYVLGRLSNQELIAAPRSEFVYVALLDRQGLEPRFRLESLHGLASLRHTDPLTELIKGLADLDKKGDDALDTIRDLSRFLLQQSSADLASKRAALESLANSAQIGPTRQGAYAALLTGDN